MDTTTTTNQPSTVDSQETPGSSANVTTQQVSTVDTQTSAFNIEEFEAELTQPDIPNEQEIRYQELIKKQSAAINQLRSEIKQLKAVNLNLATTTSQPKPEGFDDILIKEFGGLMK